MKLFPWKMADWLLVDSGDELLLILYCLRIGSRCSFIKAKSELCLEDVRALVEIGLDVFHASCYKLHAQVMFLFWMTISISPHTFDDWRSILLFRLDGVVFLLES